MNTVIKKLALVSLLLIAVWFIPETVQAVVRANASGSLSVSGPGDTPAGATVSVSISGSNMKNWTLYRYAGSACSPSYVWGCSSSIIKSGSGNPSGTVSNTVPNSATAIFYKLGGTDTSGQLVFDDSSLFYVYAYSVSLDSPTYALNGDTKFRVTGKECKDGFCNPKSGLTVALNGGVVSTSCGVVGYSPFSKSTDSNGIAEFPAASGGQVGYVIFFVTIGTSTVGGSTSYSGAELVSLSTANTTVNTGQNVSASYQVKNMFGSACDSVFVPAVMLTNWNYQVFDPANKVVKQASGSSSQGGNIDFIPNAVGNYTIKLETTQSNGYKESKSLSITAKPVNNPPIIDSFTCASPITLSSGKADSTCAIQAHDPDTGNTLTYAIARSDTGETKTGSSATFTFTKDGNYTMVAAVKDNNNVQASQKNFTVVVNQEPVSVNNPPVISNFFCTSPITLASGKADSTCTITASDPDSESLIYVITRVDNLEMKTNNPATFTFTKDGNFNMNAAAVDNKGAQATQKTFTIIVNKEGGTNQAPTVSISAPATAQTGQQVTFTINISDPNGASDIKAWSLESNELNVLTSGNSAETNKPFYKTFNSAGTIHYLLQAEDKSGTLSNQATGAITITVSASAPQNQAPNITNYGCDPDNPKVNESVSCSLSASDSDDTSLWYRIQITGPDNRDSGWMGPNNADGFSITYNPPQVGNYTANFSVKDEAGLSDSKSISFTVTAPAPVPVPVNQIPITDFSASPLSGDKPLQVQFTDLSSDADGFIVSWKWDFNGDNVIDSAQQNPKNTYSSVGTYTVTLLAEDNQGASKLKVKSSYVSVNESGSCDTTNNGCGVGSCYPSQINWQRDCTPDNFGAGDDSWCETNTSVCGLTCPACEVDSFGNPIFQPDRDPACSPCVWFQEIKP